MDAKREAEIWARWKEIDRQLADIANGRVVADDPAALEGELLDELDAIEGELGQDYLDNRR